jgi:hypothetical protein
MAIDSQQKQSSLEERIYPIDWTPALLDGVTVSSVTISHTPPSGNDATITGTVTTPISYIKVPSGLAVGVHTVSVVATTSNADLSPEVRLIIRVDY